MFTSSCILLSMVGGGLAVSIPVPWGFKNHVHVNARYPPKNTPLHSATLAQNKTKIEHLLEKGADVNARNNKGQTPLDLASVQGNADIVRLLLEGGADAKIFYSATPLQYASYYGKKEVIPVLLEYGADVNGTNNVGLPPLDLASMKGNADIVKLLLENHANVNTKDTKEYTPLHWATIAKSTDAIKDLLEHKADVNARNIYGRTPLDFAKGKPEIVTLLRNASATEKQKFWHFPRNYLKSSFIATESLIRRHYRIDYMRQSDQQMFTNFRNLNKM